MRTCAAMLVWTLAGCGEVSDKPRDASVSHDVATSPDARAICDPRGEFDLPVRLAGFDTPGFEGVPRLSSDELDLYFGGQLNADAATKIYRAQRGTVDDTFGTPLELARVDDPDAADLNPSLSSDGLTLFFESDRVVKESNRLHVATRTSKIDEFNVPSEVANLNSGIAGVDDGQPFVTIDGAELWFTSNRAGGLGAADIYRAIGNGSTFANPTPVNGLNTPQNDFLPTLSSDKLTIYLSSTRTDGMGGHDIWVAHRSTTSDGFPLPTVVSELNSTTNDFAGWISPDNCRMYLSSDREGTRDIYVATRHPM